MRMKRLRSRIFSNGGTSMSCLPFVRSTSQAHSRQIFPAQVNHVRSVNEDSVIAKIKERRRLINAGLWNTRQGMLNKDTPGTSAAGV